ncbi:MAG TPA: hypothetical protein VN207_10780 [Ktedonobacteraceae bacterium]|nr:hypothetical protein [Ktedonobacteraceae bacterium]
MGARNGEFLFPDMGELAYYLLFRGYAMRYCNILRRIEEKEKNRYCPLRLT